MAKGEVRCESICPYSGKQCQSSMERHEKFDGSHFWRQGREMGFWTDDSPGGTGKMTHRQDV